MSAPAAAQVPRRKTPWTIVYPVYFNARRTVAEGRRVSTAKSVDNPTTTEIVEVCKQLGLPAEKAFPRDALHPGRVRIRLRTEEGNPIHAQIPNKTELLRRLAADIKSLPSRANAAAAATAASQPSGKKGKKGRG